MSGSTEARLRGQGRPHARAWLPLLSLILVALFLGGAPQADAAGIPSGALDRSDGFPLWYQDNAGNRVELCIDPADPNCIVLGGPTFNTLEPLSFPTNFPDEAFYAVADSVPVDTPGCDTPPGKATLRVALEAAFINGDPAPGEQMVFGRIRVKVTSGLCANTVYKFRHPFGTETIRTDDVGGVTATMGTEDVGCAPLPPAKCDFAEAGASRVFGGPTDGFLRWDPDPALGAPAPAGYLGDAVTPHKVVGGTSGNRFDILDSSGHDLGIGTDLFTVAGKLAGSLLADPTPVDFGGQELTLPGAPGPSVSAPRTVTMTNLDRSPVTVTDLAIAHDDTLSFDVAADNCSGKTLGRDESCTADVTFAPRGDAGPRSAQLLATSTGGVRSPLKVDLLGKAINAGDAPAVALSAGSVAFPDTRLRTTSSTKTVTVTNSGTAPLAVRDVSLTGGISHFSIATDTCTTGRTIDVGKTCIIGVQFAPVLGGPHTARLHITANTNDPVPAVVLSGTATGGVAAVSPSTDADNGFPTWYRDEEGTTVSQCVDPKDPNCIVLPDAFFSPAKPLAFPTNFPEEFFYFDAQSDDVATPGCDGTSPGRAYVRSSLEGAFTNDAPADKDQMTFGRLRIVVTSGLCPNTEYAFTTPYGTVHLTTDIAGAIRRNVGTEDVGCFPVSPKTCDFSLALTSRIEAGYLRWDPAVGPAAPAGYLGDGQRLHRVVGSPYKPDGKTPTNSFAIAGANGAEVGRTDLFTVMGKLKGPLEVSTDAPDLGVTPVGSTSATQTITLTNTGAKQIDVTSRTLAGPDAADFTVGGGDCVGAHLAPDASCTVLVSFAPSATGTRTASLQVRHTGLNDPVVVPLRGVGAAQGSSAAISFQPRSVAFAPLHVGRTSQARDVTIFNAGGNSPLGISKVALGGADAAAFHVVSNGCKAPVDPDGSCTVSVAFTPQAAGAANASLVVTDNAPGATHSVPLSGTGSTAAPAVSSTKDSRNGFPQWYGDANGVRVEPCLNAADANCILPADAGFNPLLALQFPANFPTEFFYSFADSDEIQTPGCGGTAPGTALLGVALEGTFANGTPAAGDQITFGRIRITVTSGLCPDTPYEFRTPYGPVTITTNAAGGTRGVTGATSDVGCGTAPCTYTDALASKVADSFLRWDPAVSAPPAGYLGDGVTLHKVVGATARRTDGTPINAFSIRDAAGNLVGRTDLFRVSGKLAGPLTSDAADLDFGHLEVGGTSPAKTVTVTNVGPAPMAVSDIALSGAQAGSFAIAGGTCAGATVAPDATCTVDVTFTPAGAPGTRSATLRVVPATGPVATVALAGVADPARAPIATVTPAALGFGTVVAGQSATKTTTVTNTGNAPLSITGKSIIGTAAADYSVSGGTCGSTVAAGDSCTITVRFSPSAIGSRPATLEIAHNAANGKTAVSLSATGNGSTFSLSPSPVTFGGITKATTKSQTVTLRNTGNLAFVPRSASIAGDPAGAYSVPAQSGCLNVLLQPGKTCNLTVNFRPPAAATYNARLVVNGDASSLPASVSATLTGSGK